MKLLLKDSVASSFTFKGQRGKLNFSSTNSFLSLRGMLININWYHVAIKNCCIFIIVFLYADAALSTGNFKTTEKDIENAVKEWLRHTNQRLKAATAVVVNPAAEAPVNNNE